MHLPSPNHRPSVRLRLSQTTWTPPSNPANPTTRAMRAANRFGGTGPHRTITASPSLPPVPSADVSAWTAAYASFTLNGSGSFAYTDTAASPSVRFYRASISSPSQQSCNLVGYADLTVTGGVLKMIANPLNALDN